MLPPPLLAGPRSFCDLESHSYLPELGRVRDGVSGEQAPRLGSCPTLCYGPRPCWPLASLGGSEDLSKVGLAPAGSCSEGLGGAESGQGARDRVGVSGWEGGTEHRVCRGWAARGRV